MDKYLLNNLDCVNCATKLEKAIQETNGAGSASIDFMTKKLYLDADDLADVKETINKIQPDVKLLPLEESELDDLTRSKWKEIGSLLFAVAFYILGLIFYRYLSSTALGIGEYLVFGMSYGISGWSVIHKAFKNITRGQIFDENFLMTVATIGAIIIGEIPEAAGVMIFYMVGEFLQERSLRRSRQSVKALMKTRPNQATIIRNGKMKIVNPKMVEVGQEFIVKPGEKVPLDGKILLGESTIDTSPLTGESKPKVVKPGDSVFAGSINKEGLLTIVAERPFSDSSFSRIVEITENAISRKAQTERFITRFARIYSPIVVICALGVAIVQPLFFGASLDEWIYRALVVLVISCPCALVISIPLGYFGGIGGASRRGILVKGSNYLDILASVKTLVFDKTGTLTRGVFTVTDIRPYNGFNKDELLSLAAQAEAGSNHPIAQSIRNANSERLNIHITPTEEIAGHGLKAIVNGKYVVIGNDILLHKEDILHDQEICDVIGTTVHIAVDGTYAGYIQISDELKPDAVKTIRRLRENGIRKLVMLTGDKLEIAQKIAQQLRLDEYEAELLPEGKTSFLESIINKGDQNGKVGFVGDGINDAPALARADVGIAMGALGSEAAMEAADVVIMSDSPGKIIEAIQIARKTRSVVWQNIGFALIVKTAFILLGITGNATMWQAVFGDMGVALIAILNASRILGYRPDGVESKV